MANVAAAQNGDFSATSTWVGGVVPGPGDVAYANTRTVTISDTRTVQAIGNASASGITAGGTFSILNGCNLTCTNANGVLQGATSTSCITTPSLGVGSSAILAANITGTSNLLMYLTGAGTLNTLGNYVGAGGFLVQIDAGTLNHTGSITAGSNRCVVMQGGTAVINVTGNVSGGSSGNSEAILLNATGCIANVTGNATGGSGGAALAITAAAGITATLTVNGTCQSSSAAPAIGLGSHTQVTRLSGPFLLGASGNINPVQAASWRWAPTQIPTYMEVPTSGGSTKRNLYTADNMPTGGYPVVANVRLHTVYGPSSEFTGTLAVPSPSSVAFGVATDNTVGTAVLTAASVRSAMGLASANLDTQLSGIPAAVWAAATRTLTTAIPTAADVASAVWSAVSRTITGGTVDTLANSPSVPSAATIASAVWSAVTRTITGGTVDTLTNAPTVPSAAAIASQVRTELSTELNRIDVATSTRLAAAAYTAPPTTAAIRTELSVELARLDAAVSTRLAASSYTAPTTPPSAASIASTVWSNATRTITGGTIDNAPSSAPTAATVASAVRSELTPELARLSNCATVDTTATTIQDALSPN